MGGRNAKPVSLHVAEGNPNRLTKEEIQRRKEAEVKLGTQDLKKLKKPRYVTRDKVANKLWNDLIKEYNSAAEQGIELLTSSDVGTLALYCKTFSEYEHLLSARQRIENIAVDADDLEEYMQDSEMFDYKARVQMTQLISTDGILRIEAAINKKMDMLLKFQDRLFLNPLAKVKNVTKPQKKDEDKPQRKFAKFGG